ncbi:MAG: hypothetical protein WBM43_08950, partial [Flavobacteriaceae bacterium]
EEDLVIGTFGRAAWVLDDIRPLRAIAEDPALLEQEIELFTPPDAYLAAYQQPTGSRFGGDALYNAENRQKGAMITYYLKEGYKKKKVDGKTSENKADEASKEDNTKADEKVKKDSIKLKVYEKDQLIRTLKFKTPEKAGFHRVYWNLDQRGVQNPTRKISKDSKEAAGMMVRPGKYRLVMELGENSDTTEIEVLADPRLETNPTAQEEIFSAREDLTNYKQLAADAVEQLVESKSTTEELLKKLKKQDKDAFEANIESSEEMIKSIDSLLALYLGKEDKRQGIIRNQEMTVMKRIRTAERYIQTSRNEFSSTEQKLVQFAREDLGKALKETNEFYAVKWSEYKTAIDALSLSPFKEVKSFELE